MTRKVDSKFVWLDGKIVSADEAKVSFFAHVVHYGTGVFEGVRCYDGEHGPAVFRLPEHLRRLRDSAAHYYMEYAWTDDELTRATCDLITRHEMRECYVRPVVLTGEGYLGVRPRECEINVYLAVWSWGAYLGPEALEKGVRVTIVDQRKYHPAALDPKVKAVGHYLNSVRATKQAAAKGFDEGLLLNVDGRIAEGSGENLFLVKGGRLVTAPPEEALLPGITRDSVIEIAKGMGIETRIAPISVEDLLGADEAFFTGTAAEVSPIRELDGKQIGSGARGEVTEKLQAAYLSAVRGRLPGYGKWLTKVETGQPATT